MRVKPQAEIGVFGGSGFYKFLSDVEERAIDTPFGPPSDRVSIATLGGKRVAFLPRHGVHHSIPPQKINYRANVWAMRKLGVTRVIGPCAAGSLQAHVKPSHFVVCDQFVDRTTGRADTFCEGPNVYHVSLAEPYCPELRQIAIRETRALGITTHERGTVVVIQGPRFSTRAESRWFADQGWEVINMTQFPEVALARELGMCYLNISLITDFDAGLEGHPDVKPVTHDEVLRVFSENNDKLRGLLERIIAAIPAERRCGCAGTAQAGG